MATSIEEVAMNVRYRVELSEVERGELRAMPGVGRPQAQAGPDPAGGRRRGRGRDPRHQPRRRRLDRLPRQAPLRGGRRGTGARRGAAPGRGAQAQRQGGSAAGGHRVRQPARGAGPLDPGAAGRGGGARGPGWLWAGGWGPRPRPASLSRETVRRRLAENALKPWRQKMWCIPRVNGEFVARMEDVLDLYAEAPDPKRPVVCFDESPTQLIGEVRQRIPPEPGQVERFDYEYRRAGTVNLFVLVDAHRPWRKVTVTQQRTALDFARCMRELVEVDHPQAERVRVVLDNLSIHTPGALYEAFPAEEAHRLLRRLEFHFTPKHASWLNMAEIEIGVLKGQCLNRRIADRERLEREIAAWQRGRNAAEAKIEWMFTTEAARTKLGRFYPHPPVADLPGTLMITVQRN